MVALPIYSNNSLTTQAAGAAIDLATFNNLVLQYQDAVYRHAYAILNDPAAAEDATQEAFLRAYCNIHRYNGGPFLPWVMRIATNYCFDQLRRRKFRKTTPLEPLDANDDEVETPAWLRDPAPAVEEVIDQSERLAQVARCLRKLPPVYRQALQLVDVEEMNYSDAASAAGVCIGTFKSRLARARAMLQQQVSLN